MSPPDADVLVIGGGPAGVAAALELRRQGVAHVILLEREQYLGGATRHCAHSPFGMVEFGQVYFGAAYGRRLEQAVAKAGVEVRYGHAVVSLEEGGVVQVSRAAGLQRLRGRRVLLATGAREAPRAMRMISGERPIGVLTTGALQSSLVFEKLRPFRRPVIVGSELVSYSAILTCLTHGIRPAALLEARKTALAGRPWHWFPALTRIPFYRSSTIVDIHGRDRVEAVTISCDGVLKQIACDGVLLTGQFIPEASLLRMSGFEVEPGSQGPPVDQNGCGADPAYYAAGNVLRAVETGGWAFREGRAVGRSIAAALRSEPSPLAPTRVFHDAPIRLVVPGMIRQGARLPGGLSRFQLRFVRSVRGRVRLLIDNVQTWEQRGLWREETRYLAPMPANIGQATKVEFRFEEDR